MFEVLARHYLARLGRLTLGEVYSTPMIIERGSALERRILETKSAWAPSALESSVLEGGGDYVVVLPHKCPPASMREEATSFYRSLKGLYAKLCESSAPKGEVVCPATPELVPKRELYVLGAAQSMRREPRWFVECMLALRERQPYNIPIYAPALAEPANLAALVLCGVDLVDDVVCLDAAMKGEAFTREGRLQWEELVCHCPECHERKVDDGSFEERLESVYRHNLWMLREELASIRHYLAVGRLREYVEAKMGFSSWACVALSLLDSMYERVEPFVHVYSATSLQANTELSLRRVEVVRFANRVVERFMPRTCDTLVVLPCSARKPYSTSPSHRAFMRITGRFDVQEVIITSPLGVVPRELELVYPCAHYDIPVSGVWSEDEIAWGTRCLTRFLERTHYENVVVHAEGGFLEVCKRAAAQMGYEPTYTCEGVPTSAESLRALKETLERVAQPAPRRELEDVVRAMCGYQFGAGLSEHLIRGDIRLEGRYPRLRVYEDGRHLFSTVPEHGKLSLSVLAGERLLRCNAYKVEIEEFVPHGSITVRGITSVSPEVRAGDEVVFYGERCMGVGTALMGATEMQTSTYGAAVSVRGYRER